MVLLAAALWLLPLLPADPSYVAATQQWRMDAEARLTADDGWLTVAGLFWLQEGPNEIDLPADARPSRIGVFEFAHGRVVFHAAPGAAVTHNGKPVQVLELRSDDGGAEPDQLVAGRFTLFIIKRGPRYAVRLRDKNSRMRREFTRRTWFPVKQEYRVAADWVPYRPPKSLAVPNVLGQTEQQPCPGVAVFRLHGAEYRLEPVLEDGRLFFIFKDLTAGKATYPAGRFLYSEVGPDGKVVLDFNRAYNPPCAFTPYATCPLPPKQNRLAVAIEAGELTYHHD